MCRVLCVLAAASLLALSTAATAVTIHVPADQPTIQAGIDATSYGDTVLVACGTYYEHDIIMKSGVCLISETGEADCVTIDAEGLSRVMYCEDVDETTTIEGFLLSNGFMGDAGGGGVFCSSSSPTFRSCTFADNFAGDSWSPVGGGGMRCEGSSPVLVSCEFSNNRAVGAGGGLNCVAESSPTLTDCLFSGNFAEEYRDGGGMGGGVYCSDSSPTLTGCTFTGNEAADDGYSYPGTGGGMYCDGSTPLLTNCTFSRNAARDVWEVDGHGGGMYCSGSSLTLINTIIAFSTDGEAVYCDDTSDMTLTCCNIFGNDGGDWVGCVADQCGQDGNILGDPRFCDAAQGDFTIAENSPCAPENNPECGLIGALSVGCGVVVPPEGHVAVSDTLLAFGRVCIASAGSETVLVSNSGTGWLTVHEISADHPDFSADPPSVAVPPGDSRTAEVSFTPSSTGLITGTLTILSDDPEYPAVEIPLEGEGVGLELAISDTLLSFGSVLIGAARWDHLFVTNVGCGLLTVSDISIDHEDFSANTTSFSLEPEDSREVAVEFAPSTSGSITATMTILSDDSDDPELEISLEGEGSVPPEIAVSPDSLCADLLVGETETQHITIENTGASELVWSARAIDRAGAHDATFADLTGIEILWDQRHGQGPWTHTTVVAQLESRGATVTENYARINDVLLSGYDIVWITDRCDNWPYNNWWYTEAQALADWMALGGSLLLEGEEDSSVAVFNDILTALGAGIEYSATDGTAGLTTSIHPHQTTQGVDYVHLWYPRAHLSVVASPAFQLIDDSAEVPNSACSAVGFGRVVTMASDLANNFHLTHGNTGVFVNQVFDWLARGSTCTWLSCEPSSGTVVVGGSVEVGVTFDATELIGGDYLADVQVWSNDLDDPRTYVAACLHVTGVPDIAVSETFLAFGEVEVGAVVAETLLVWNEGTDLLTVSDASSDHADFSVDPVSFAVPPEESQAVVVEFSPSSEGLITGTLTILSDDPDEGTLLVALGGTGTSTTPVEYSLYATATESGTVMLRWTVPSLSAVDGFNVYRATAEWGPFTRVNEEAVPPSSPGEFADSTVWSETTFWYELRAVFSDGSEVAIAGSPASVTTGGHLALRLFAPSPNPCRTIARIQFDLPDEAAPVRLAVYNVRGQLVRTVFRGRLARGRHVLTWDVRDERGLRASSGAYFIRLETSARTATQKILVLN